MFTPTEQRIIDALSDGRPRKVDDLRQVIDDFATTNTLRVHIHHIRQKLQRLGQDIICQTNGHGSAYIHVRLLSSPYDGHR